MERILTLRIKQEIIKKARWKRKKLAVRLIKNKLERMVKDKIYISPNLSQLIFKLPKKIRIRLYKDGKWKAETI